MQVSLFDETRPSSPAAAVVTGSPSSNVSGPVLDLLRAAVIEDCTLRPLPAVGRETYEEFNDVLTRLRGKWKRGKGHVFPYDPTAAIAAVIESGRAPAKNPLAYFPTPAELAAAIVTALECDPKTMLEPSAGAGALIRAARDRWPELDVTAIEVDPLNVAMLADAGATVIEADFLAHDFGDQRFDLIVMNPPFAVDGDKIAWATHMRRAFDLLADGGTLVCIAPLGSWQTSTRKALASLRVWLASVGASVVEHERGAFLESGTGVSTCTITIRHGAAPVAALAETLRPARDPSPELEPVADLEVLVAELMESTREADRAMFELARELSESLGLDVPGFDLPDDHEWL